WSSYKAVFEAKRRRPFLDLIKGEEPPEPGDRLSAEGLQLLGQLKETPTSERLEVLAAYIRAAVTEIMGLDPSYVFEPQQGFFQIGMDSLMAVELKTSLESKLGRTLPPTITFEYPTIEALADYLASEVLDLHKAEPVRAEVVEDEARLEEAITKLAGSS